MMEVRVAGLRVERAARTVKRTGAGLVSPRSARDRNVYTGGVAARAMVTGANGFVGRSLCPVLKDAGFFVRAAVRGAGGREPLGGDVMSVGDIGPETTWDKALVDVDVVVHLAARVHVLRETLEDPEDECRRVNVLGTERLAHHAARAGVKRLVYVSTTGVNGSSTAGPAVTETSTPSPANAYARSKWEAEKVLSRIAGETGLEVVILRPPLIYGPGVKANFLRLMGLVYRGLPLPLGSINNRRSLLYVGNLTDAILECVHAPEAAGETFLLSDGEDVSTPELARRIRVALGSGSRILPFPPAALRMAGRLVGKSSSIEPLLESMVVDTAKIRNTLGWRPPYTMDHGLRETARWFKSSSHTGKAI